MELPIDKEILDEYDAETPSTSTTTTHELADEYVTELRSSDELNDQSVELRSCLSEESGSAVSSQDAMQESGSEVTVLPVAFHMRL